MRPTYESNFHFTEEEARDKACPYSMSRSYPRNCLGKLCVSFVEVYPRIEREDHSGGYENVNLIAIETNRHVRREGGPGCMGKFIIDAVYTCLRLKNKIQKP